MCDSFCVKFSEHFIFNTLNCSISLCRKNPRAAEDILVALSECLHYSAEGSQKYVSLEEEVDFLKDYLYIQSVRFDSRLRIEYDIDNNINDTIPRFSMYNGVKRVLNDEMGGNREPFKITIRVKVLQSISVSVCINDLCKWQIVY